MDQLKMVFDVTKKPISLPVLPDGYYMRTYRAGDGQGWCECCIHGSLGIEETSEEAFASKMLMDDHVSPDNIYFLVAPSGDIAGTTTYQYSDQPSVGIIHMVGMSQRFLGKGLSLPMLLYVMQAIANDDRTYIELTTDDWRLPAIKTYLKAGFEPYLQGQDMEVRWADVMARINGSA